MAGEFTNGSGNSPEELANNDQKEKMSTGEPEETKFETDVKDVFSDDQVTQGNDKFPVFDVSSHEFHQNMAYGRRRLRFKSGTPAQQYHQNTRYNRPFYVRHTDSKGKKYVRKVEKNKQR